MMAAPGPVRTLIVGARGQLGSCLMDTVPAGVEATAVDVDRLDITDRNATERLIAQLDPDWIINAAAYTAVDRAESEPDLAHAINVDAVGHVADAAARVGAGVVHISTDFVFDGSQRHPYEPNDPASPMSVYGRTKLQGEDLLLERLPERGIVIRTAWLHSEYGQNFVKTMLALMQSRDELNVVDDQVGTPTYARGLAELVWRAVLDEVGAGRYHWTDAGHTTWYDFAVEIQRQAEALGFLANRARILPISSADYPSQAVRPQYSVLECGQTVAEFGVQQRPWQEMLSAMLARLRAAG